MTPEPALETASLSASERRVLVRFVEALRARLGDDLVSVWLYGSRARGEPPSEFSDVDVMVVTRAGADDRRLVHKLGWDAAERENVNPFALSTIVDDPEWIAGRREIESFFMQEVDRDKIVLFGVA